jgi:hypothetical protein
MNVDYNTHCYNFKKMRYNEGFLDDSVDATYIIHLKDNGRLDHIYQQLAEYQPTKTVYIAFNLGFKNCKKELIEQVSYQDLSDAFLQCFTHANEHGYNNILVLEDDFIFSPKIKERENLKSMQQFLKSKNREAFVYYLGCNPILIAPCTTDFSHYRVFKSFSMHAIIYSKEARNISLLPLEEKHWDVIVEKGVKNRYMYCNALCYQTYPDTENKQTWSEKDNIIIFYLKEFVIKTLGLDKQPEPGFSILYLIAKILNLFLFLSILILIMCGFRLLMGRNKMSFLKKYSYKNR